MGLSMTSQTTSQADSCCLEISKYIHWELLGHQALFCRNRPLESRDFGKGTISLDHIPVPALWLIAIAVILGQVIVHLQPENKLSSTLRQRERYRWGYIL